MTTSTAGALLFGAHGAAGALPGKRGWRTVLDRAYAGALDAVSAAGRGVVERELAAAIDSSLRLDIGQVLVGGWRKHGSLKAAAEATVADPARTETVTLASHQITIAQHPYLEIVINGIKLATIHCELGINLDVDGVVAVVRKARLVTIQGGRVDASLALRCEGVEVMSQRVTGIDPVLTVKLGPGVALLR